MDAITVLAAMQDLKSLPDDHSDLCRMGSKTLFSRVLAVLFHYYFPIRSLKLVDEIIELF
jgi:hypothetical protein